MTNDAVTTLHTPASRVARTVLVVDDEVSAVKLITMTLARRYRVRGVHTLAEGRDALRAEAPDLLILDVRLGEEDGLELLAEFRRSSRAPVLLMTGFGSEAVAARALDLHVDGYLRKPFDLSELRVKVDALLAEGPHTEHLAERARSLIDRIATESLTAGELAERLGVKPGHLMVAFRERYGQTPMQYLRAVRLARARELLLTTRLSVTEVAARVGFREVAYFDRSFKQHSGVTPLEYRTSSGRSASS